MGIRDRLHRLERQLRDPGPSLEEVSITFERMAESARAKLCGKSVDEDQRVLDHDTVHRWHRAQGVDLEGEAQRARDELKKARTQSSAGT